MKLTIAHEFHTDVDTFWSKLFFDPVYNRALYIDALKFPEYNLLEEKDQGSTVLRRVRVTPKNEAPAVVQKVVGGNFSYVEEGTFDKATKRYRFKAIPDKMADKFVSSGELRAEPLGDKRCRRVAEMNIEVKIFGVGGMVESFIAKSMNESYEQVAAFSNRWITEKGL